METNQGIYDLLKFLQVTFLYNSRFYTYVWFDPNVKGQFDAQPVFLSAYLQAFSFSETAENEVEEKHSPCGNNSLSSITV